MITTLTPEQKAKFPEYVDKWLKIGSQTGDANIEACKEIIPRVYAQVNLPAPTEYQIMDSPLDAVNKVCRRLKIPPEKVHHHQIFGSQEGYWLSFYDFFLKEYNLECCNTLVPLMDLAKHCGWWMPYSDLAVIQHHPNEIHLVDGLLHNENGPSIRYRDGFSVWSIQGVRVNEQIVLKPETQTLSQIRDEENAEIKRIRIERYGWVSYIEENKGITVDSRINDIDGTKEALVTCDGMKILLCTCKSTARMYALEVPNEIVSCLEAQNWMSPDGFCIGAS